MSVTIDTLVSGLIISASAWLFLQVAMEAHPERGWLCRHILSRVCRFVYACSLLITGIMFLYSGERFQWYRIGAVLALNLWGFTDLVFLIVSSFRERARLHSIYLLATAQGARTDVVDLGKVRKVR